MRIVITENSWEDYNSWLIEDRKMIKKINELVKDIQRTLFSGKGKPEPLNYDLAGFWSRRIHRENHLIHKVE